MILILFLLMPAIACLGWIILNFFISRRTQTYGIFTLFLIMLGLFLVTDSSYANPDVNPELLVYMTTLELFAGPCLIPLIWMYLYQLKHRTNFTTVQWTWVIIPIVFLTASALITHLKGVEGIAEYLNNIYTGGGLESAREANKTDHLLRAYYLWTFVLFRVVIGSQLVLGFVLLIIHTQKYKFDSKGFRKFWRKGEELPIVQIQYMNLFLPIVLVIAKILLGNRMIQQHPILLIILSVAMAASAFNLAFSALFGAKEKVTLESMRHVMVYNYNDKIKSVIVEFTMDDLMYETDESGLRRLQKKIGDLLPPEEEQDNQNKQPGAKKENLFASMSSTWDEDSLLSRFQNLMVKEQLFLQPSLTLGEVADRLRTNKTYVSKLVNNTYNLGFPELLNTLRIDYAEQYILSHRDARQDEIAAACGFLSASSFNSIFKKVTGVTPKVWIAGVHHMKPE